MTDLKLSSTVQRNDKDVAETEFEDNMVLLHIEHGKYYNFNQTSSDLWRWLQEQTTGEKLSEQLLQKYDCDLEQSQADVIKFLHELQNVDLLTIKV